MVNRAHARSRALGERAVATLKAWNAVAAPLLLSPSHPIVQAVLVLQAFEDNRYSG
ncbi:hypothetical protein Mame01_53320 [Microbispora amethystogenes]|nr:hypothetical protein Mame01_53320 [Microbispora amethystogenes]